MRLRGYCRGKNRAFARSDAMLRTLKRRLQEPGLSVAAMRRSFLANLRFSKYVLVSCFILKTVFKMHLKLQVIVLIAILTFMLLVLMF